MRQYKITKYNPINRDISGAYLLDEWTEFSDVGKLTDIKEYEVVERQYIESLKLLLSDNQITSLKLVGLEDYQKLCPFKKTGSIPEHEFGNAFRSVLRSEYWCKFEAKHAYVHFGYDFYSYIGVPTASEYTIKRIEKKGLFIENCHSPFLDNGT